MVEFLMPSLGADMESGVLLEWLVQPGSTVRRGEPMAVVDTDKAAVEVESFHDGVVGDLLVQPGQRVAVGAPLATIDDEAAAPAPVHRLAAPPVRHHAAELGVDIATVPGSGRRGAVTRADVDRAARVPEPPSAGRSAGRASPYARRLADKLGVDLDQVPSSSPDGAVRAEDVMAAAGGPAPPVTEAEHDAQPPAPRGGSRAAIAALMSRSKREIPHYYVATTVDMQAVLEWLRRRNRELPLSERIIPAAALLRATALALRDHPELNGSWVDDRFVPAEQVHLGVAISVRDSQLVAPALHRADDLALPELMTRLRDLVRRARSGHLGRTELTDPTFTVTDLGDQGVEDLVGVIYPPQVGLLGVGRMVERPWAVDGRLGVSPVVRLTLSGDHRATDGRTGAQFLAAVDSLLQQPDAL
jgi:pyruvate dehydrogenase E2 component (dihydrolipoamide acetyltransferase)